MKQLDIFVYQKNSDLHALSAFEAISRFMKKDAVKALNRYVHWEITYESPLSEQDFIESILSKTFYLLNPNKEGYYISAIESSKQKTAPVLIDVSHKEAAYRPSIVEKINKQCDTQIHRLKQSVTWACTIDAESLADAVSYTERELLSTRSIEQGIFVNPIYEDYSILDHARYVAEKAVCQESLS